MQKFALLVLAVAAGLSAGAMVGTQTIHQEGRMFSAENIVIKAGETLTFLNDDNVPHNVASTSTGNEFDLGSQRPGASTGVTFTEPGDVRVFCAIHPRMKLTVKVSQ